MLTDVMEGSQKVEYRTKKMQMLMAVEVGRLNTRFEHS